MGGELTSTPEEAAEFKTEQEGRGELDTTLKKWQDRAWKAPGDFVEGMTPELACDKMERFATRLKEVDDPSELDRRYDESREEARRRPQNALLELAYQELISARLGDLG